MTRTRPPHWFELLADTLTAITPTIPANLTRHRTAIHLDIPSRPDGYPSTTGGGSGGGSALTSVEAATIARQAPDPDHHHHLRLKADRQLVAALDALSDWRRTLDAIDHLRTTPTGDGPYCHVAKTIYGLPYDPAWTIHCTSRFPGILKWDEARPVSRFVYDFVRGFRRIPTRDEMLTHLERGIVRVHV